MVLAVSPVSVCTMVEGRMPRLFRAEHPTRAMLAVANSQVMRCAKRIVGFGDGALSSTDAAIVRATKVMPMTQS